MSQKFYKFEPGQCTCVLGDPYAGGIRTNVLKVSGTEAVIDYDGALRQDQFVYTTLEFEEGPSLSISGLVVSPAPGAMVIQWMHSDPREADKVTAAIRRYRKSRGIVEDDEDEEPEAVASAETAEPGTSEKGRTGRARAPRPLSRRGRQVQQKTPPRRIRRLKRQKKEERPAVPQKPSGDLLKELAGEDDAIESQARKVVITDGKLDVSASVLRRAKTVRASELASRVESVQVLNMSTIKELIQEAVNETVGMMATTIDEAARKRLLEEAEEEFKKRVEAFKAEKAGLEAQTKNLEQQLTQARNILEQERHKVVTANQFTVSDAGMVELEQKFGRMLDRAIKSGKVTPELEQDIRKVIAQLLDDERDKIREQEQQAQNDKIRLLEKKVGRLAGSLEQAEKERDSAKRRALALEASGGIPLHNIVEAGLDDEDPNKEKKLGLLKELIDFNRDIRQTLADAGRLPKQGREKPPKPEESADDAAGAPSSGRPEEPEARDAGAEAVEDEKELVSSLGIRRTDPGEAMREGEPAAAAEDDTADDEDTVKVNVAASGEELDPDDLPWEPSEDAADTKDVRIRRLGG